MPERCWSQILTNLEGCIKAKHNTSLLLTLKIRPIITISERNVLLLEKP